MRLAVLVMWLGLALWVSAQPARIIVIRHAEKPKDDNNPHLAPEGEARAQRLVQWLTQGKLLGTNGPPAALVAPAPSKRGFGVRCLQTLTPTAKALSLRVRAVYRPPDYAQQARDLVNDSTLRGKNVVVCWSHSELPDLAAALGVRPKPSKWKDGDYDSAYVITYPDGKATMTKVKQKLKEN